MNPNWVALTASFCFISYEIFSRAAFSLLSFANLLARPADSDARAFAALASAAMETRMRLMS